MPKILAIDDEATILDNIKFVLELHDYQVITASSGEEGLNIFSRHLHDIDAVITDMKMPRMSGMEVLRKIKRTMPEMGVIVLTGHGDMENAIQAMKEGAFEYLNKPINADVLRIAINNAIDKKNLLISNAHMQCEIIEHNNYFKGLQDSAQKILINLLPKAMPDMPGYRFSAEYRSCEAVGGDMYDVCDIGDYLCFYVFDVSSHGILASVITVILKSFIRNIEYNYRNGIGIKNFEEVVSDLNMELYANSARNVFATLFIGFLEKKTNRLHYISAGHVTQYIYNDSGITSMCSTGTVLGVFEDASYQMDTVALKPGDRILLFTDGITEASSGVECFGHTGVVSVIGKMGTSPVDSVTKKIFEAACSHTDGEVQDDMTVLGIEIL